MSMENDNFASDSAADWVLRIEEGLSENEQKEFFEWLQKEPSHMEEFDQFRLIWKDLDTWAELQDGYEQHQAKKIRWSTKHTLQIGSLAAALIMGGFLINLYVSHKQGVNKSVSDSNVYTSEMTVSILPDGSTLYTNINTSYSYTFSSLQRRVNLASGEIYVSVAEDKSRPFVIDVNGIEIRAIGTAFNVKFLDNYMELLVEEGTVNVNIQEDCPFEVCCLGFEESVNEVVFANQMLTLHLFDNTREILKPKSLTGLEVKKRFAWHHRKLVFRAEPLKDVIDEFNRLNDVQLVITDPNIENLKVSGSIKSDNLEGLTRLLELGFDIASEETPNSHILLTQKVD